MYIKDIVLCNSIVKNKVRIKMLFWKTNAISFNKILSVLIILSSASEVIAKVWIKIMCGKEGIMFTAGLYVSRPLEHYTLHFFYYLFTICSLCEIFIYNFM